MTKPFWEDTYTDPNTSTFGRPSEEIRDVVSELQPGGKVLDMGCGEGRNAIFLAECDFDVTALDISETGIRKLNQLARKKKLYINSKVADICDFHFPHSFDLIVAHGCLHLIERKAWEKIISLSKTHTKPGGINIIVVITDTIPPPEDLSDFFIGLFCEGEIFSLYSDWEFILQQSYVFEDEHPGGLSHTHPVNKIVARKPLK